MTTVDGVTKFITRQSHPTVLATAVDIPCRTSKARIKEMTAGQDCARAALITMGMTKRSTTPNPKELGNLMGPKEATETARSNQKVGFVQFAAEPMILGTRIADGATLLREPAASTLANVVGSQLKQMETT